MPRHGGRTVARHESEVEVPARRGIGGPRAERGLPRLRLRDRSRARAAELTPLETAGAVGLGGLGGLADLEDRTDPDLVVALSDTFTDNGGPLITQADRTPPLGGYVHS